MGEQEGPRRSSWAAGSWSPAAGLDSSPVGFYARPDRQEGGSSEGVDYMHVIE